MRDLPFAVTAYEERTGTVIVRDVWTVFPEDEVVRGAVGTQEWLLGQLRQVVRNGGRKPEDHVYWIELLTDAEAEELDHVHDAA